MKNKPSSLLPKSILLFFIGILTLVPFGISSAADPRSMTFPVVEFHPPKGERVVLDSGMILYLLEDHELPLIKINAMVRTGGVYEPADKVGLASLTGEVMRTGGTVEVSGDRMDEELEFIAASLSSVIGRDSGYASLNILKKDFKRGLELFAGMMMDPAFPEEKLDLAKKQALEEIRRRNDQPSRIANRAFFKAVYGLNHPLARQDSLESIGKITREDLVRFHAAHYRPDAVIMAVSGDFETKAMISRVEQAFSGWNPGEGELPGLPEIQRPFEPSVRLVEKDLTQTHIRVGHLGIRQDDPDYFAVSILDDILGSGGFQSRLFKEVRTNLGLAYSVGSVFSPGKLERGVFVAYCE
ncbi:MAG TPA: pitrilysin family protein, partial [Nitrospiria bacterium]|nr:pitrilysin family protein [Nitrospiria bacterium]